MVFIHGESYEWNSGNPYDGSVLASYGDVIVITVNFRLGILGFLRPAMKSNYTSNYGILDIVAALQWIRECIQEFGGDPRLVTIFGHGTGASLTNLILVSPFARAGLFRRAILMSGSALAKWSFTWDPYKYTIQVAKDLKCPLTDELVHCLQRKTVDELLSVHLETPPFTTCLGPIKDRNLLKEEDNIRMLMALDKETISKYDLMYGVTSAESFNILKASEVKYGMTQERANQMIRAYISNTYKKQTAALYRAIENAYPRWNSSSGRLSTRGVEVKHRDRMLEILSDAQINVPVTELANLHSSHNSRSFFYVFHHQSKFGDFPINQGAIHGEEMPYVFGAPVVNGLSHFGKNYTRDEVFLSELVMTYWTNFAKSGNPNLPTPQRYLTNGAPFNWLENQRMMWPPYDSITQPYLHIDMQVVTKSHFRARQVTFWSRVIPDLLHSLQTKLHFKNHRTHISFVPEVKTPHPRRFEKERKPMPIPTVKSVLPPHQNTNNYDKNIEKLELLKKGLGSDPDATPPIFAKMSTHVIIVLGVVIILMNCVFITVFYYKKYYLPGRIMNETENSNNTDTASHDKISLNNSIPSQKSIQKEPTYEKRKIQNSEPSKDQIYEKSPSSSHNLAKFVVKKDSTKLASDKSSSTGKYATDRPSHKRNKSEHSIELAPKSSNHSSTSLASIHSHSSKVSNLSRTSSKNNSRKNVIKKNASCQSLPTEEFGCGITPDMLKSDSKENFSKRIKSREYSDAFENIPHHSEYRSSTLPKTRPINLNKTISDLDNSLEIESYKPSEPAVNESTLRIGAGEAPASPTSIFDSLEKDSDLVKRPKFNFSKHPLSPQKLWNKSPQKFTDFAQSSKIQPPMPLIESIPQPNKPNAPPNSLSLTESSISDKELRNSVDTETYNLNSNSKDTFENLIDNARKSLVEKKLIPTSSSDYHPSSRNGSLNRRKSLTKDSNSIYLDESKDKNTSKKKKKESSKPVEKLQEKPLKSVLKTTSAYDKRPTTGYSSGPEDNRTRSNRNSRSTDHCNNQDRPNLNSFRNHYDTNLRPEN